LVRFNGSMGLWDWGGSSCPGAQVLFGTNTWNVQVLRTLHLIFPEVQTLAFSWAM
jgi:hypothetical protein